MHVRRTEITTEVDRGDGYGYRVRFQGGDGQFITVAFRCERWLDDDDAVKRQALAMMAHTVSTPGPLHAYEISSGEIPDPVELVEEAQSDEISEEDDDNAYQDSDEALPSDAEEAAIRRDPSREGVRFDET